MENSEVNEVNTGSDHLNDAEPSETEALKKELQESQNKYLYLYAEFDTFKKRTIKERSDLIKFGHENFARELLSVADNFDRALAYTKNQDALVEGIKMVRQQLQEVLSRYNVQVIKTVGEKFNPELHEAVGQEKNSEAQEGSILTELQKGYTLHGRLLRPAKVVVAIK